MQRQVRVNGAICKDVHFIHGVAVLEDVLTLFEELLLEFVDQSLECVGPQVLEVGNVEKLVLEPLLVLILILNEIVAQFLLDVGEDMQHLVEVILANHADC